MQQNGGPDGGPDKDTDSANGEFAGAPGAAGATETSPTGEPADSDSDPSLDPCRSRSWEAHLVEMNQGLADAKMGLWVNNAGALINPNNHSVGEILGALEAARWKPFSTNINPRHWGGIHLEGRTSSHPPDFKDGNWYHMIFYPATTPVYALGTTMVLHYKNDLTKPPVSFEMHCERGGLRPSSVKHGVDYLREILSKRFRRP